MDGRCCVYVDWMYGCNGVLLALLGKKAVRLYWCLCLNLKLLYVVNVVSHRNPILIYCANTLTAPWTTVLCSFF